jgi:glycosyltransferase involved in cell wall biosynthesis
VSVVVFHPSVAPFVQQVARALYEAGQLERFITTVRDDPRSWMQRVLVAAGRVAHRDMASRFQRRAVTEVPPEKVESHPWGELLRLAVGASDHDGRLTDFIWEKTEIGFDRKVARELHRGLTGVYGFEHSSLYTFERAKQLGLKVAYEMPSPEAQFVQRILDVELDRFPELKTAYYRYTAAKQERRIARRREEWNRADVVIAYSTYTRKSFAAMGLDVSKVRVVPLGAPPVAARDAVLAPVAGSDSRLVFLWAGTFGIRKGAHYLLDAWRKANMGRHARLKIFGTIALPDRLLQPLPEGIEIGGAISRADLMAHYRSSDALVFPTLCDGWGMVVTEAWSCGLPVITTDCAGAADLLRDGENGLLIKAGDTQALCDALTWCLSNRERLKAMREASLATAAAWQWSDYRSKLAATLREERLFGTVQ